MKMNKSILMYNTDTGRKEVFVPLKEGEVGLYACGVTVYDLCHMGHARSAIVFDLIRKYFEASGYKVIYVRNFTDVDDKIIDRARERGVAWDKISSQYIDEYRKDMDLLGVRPADIEPKATDHISEIIEIVSGLIANGSAYCIGADVYFRIKSFSSYGKLSNKNLDELQAGARIEPDQRKESPMDFALWKESKEGEPAWESPWGSGRPGWHIECSAMSMKHLGRCFDIHGGGKDLIFPHHENEIAQSEAYTGEQFVRYWLHNGFVTINEEKMSKSLGNFFTIREIFKSLPFKEKITSESIRYLLLSTHYRNPIDFSLQGIKDAKNALDNFYALRQRLEEVIEKNGQKNGAGIALGEYAGKMDKAMCDDFNTAELLGILNKLRSEINKNFNQVSLEEITGYLEVIKEISSYLGLFLVPLKDWSFGSQEHAVADWEFPGFLPIEFEEEWNHGDVHEKEQVLVKARLKSREARDWKTADAIREYLSQRGRILEDRPDGSTRVKR